jgi:hypothetical protein
VLVSGLRARSLLIKVVSFVEVVDEMDTVPRADKPLEVVVTSLALVCAVY